jgi:hypothetical protein
VCTSTHIHNAQSNNNTQRRVGSYNAAKYARKTYSLHYGPHTINLADPLQVKDYRNILKKGKTSSFVPEHFLLREQEKINNSSPSYASIVAKGVKPGAKITPRSLKDLLPSWNETWTKIKDWLPLLCVELHILQKELCGGWCASYMPESYGPLADGVVHMGEIDGIPGALWVQQVNSWLKSLEQNSVELPDAIEFLDCYGQLCQAYWLPCNQIKEPKQQAPKTKIFPAAKWHLSSSDKILYKKQNNKGKAKAKTTSEEDIEILNTTQKLKGALEFLDLPGNKLDYIVNQVLVDDIWYNKPKFADPAGDWFQKFIGGMKQFSTTELAQPLIKNLETTPNALSFKDLNKDLPILQTCNEGNRRMEEATKKAAGKSYFLKTSKHGPVCHSIENPIHNKFGYCYMVAINHHIPKEGS